MKENRKVTIYFPPSFEDNILKNYDVLIMHDGQNLYYDQQAAYGVSWKIQ